MAKSTTKPAVLPKKKGAKEEAPAKGTFAEDLALLGEQEVADKERNKKKRQRLEKKKKAAEFQAEISSDDEDDAETAAEKHAASVKAAKEKRKTEKAAAAETKRQSTARENREAAHNKMLYLDYLAKCMGGLIMMSQCDPADADGILKYLMDIPFGVQAAVVAGTVPQMDDVQSVEEKKQTGQEVDDITVDEGNMTASALKRIREHESSTGKKRAKLMGEVEGAKLMGEVEDAEGSAEDAEGSAEDAEGSAEDAEGSAEDAEDAEGSADGDAMR